MKAGITQGILFQRTNGKGDELFNDILWALKAWDPRRIDMLARVHFRDNHMTCTDGHRLHELHLPDSKIPDGNYDIRFRSGQCLFLEKDPTASYPDYERVFPLDPPLWTLQCLYGCSEGNYFIADVMRLGFPANAKYLLDLFGNGGYIRMDAWGRGKALRFSAPGRRGLLMPRYSTPSFLPDTES